MRPLALYTTIYPGCKPFLSDWFASVRRQTDQDFQLWIGLDGMEIKEAVEAMGGDPGANWLASGERTTPAQVRQVALTQVLSSCDEVVLVDSDDVLHPTRVASARGSLTAGELGGCALRLVGEDGLPMGPVLRPPSGVAPDELLPRNNVFGLSNTAWRAGLLRRCLPISESVALVDWFLVTRAWLVGAQLAFDDEVGMDYRLHGANMVRVVPPFDAAQITRETGFLRLHFRLTLASPPEGADRGRLADLARVAADVDRFHHEVVADPERLERYAEALNALGTVPIWGVSVANPSLRHMWTSEEETA